MISGPTRKAEVRHPWRKSSNLKRALERSADLPVQQHFDRQLTPLIPNDNGGLGNAVQVRALIERGEGRVNDLFDSGLEGVCLRGVHGDELILS